MPKIDPKPWDSAQALARMGLHVVPVLRGTKRPVMSGWAEMATRDRAEIQALARNWPHDNVGVVLLGEHLVVDVDQPREFAGWLNDENHHLPRTMSVLTGRGRHHYYRLPGVLSGGHNTRVPGADLKVRGLVVAPGSLHPSGVRYRLASPRAMSDAPDWLIELVTATPTPAERHPGTGNPEVWTADRQQRVVSTVWAAPEGNRNNAVFWAACRAWESGLTGYALDGFLNQIVRAARHKGLERDEIDLCIRSAQQTVARGVAS